MVNKDIVSIVFGDSIAYGLYDKSYGGWVNRLRLLLENKTINNFVINLGIPGNNSNDILKRLEVELNNRYNKIDTFNLIFSFGIKDSLILNNDNKYIETFKENVLKIIDISKKYTNNIIFLGLITPNIDVRPEYKIANVIKIDTCICTICQEQTLKYLKLRDVVGKEDLYDGLHPNDIGHEKITKLLANIIE